MKRCKSCEAEKPLIEFYNARHTPDGLTARCRECTKDAARGSYQARRPAALARVHARAATMRTELASAARMYALRRFDLTPDQYAEIFASQDGLCLLCGKPEVRKRDGIVINLAVDHSHNSGQVRGLLCVNCNTKLGWVEAIGLEKIKEYIGG